MSDRPTGHEPEPLTRKQPEARGVGPAEAASELLLYLAPGEETLESEAHEVLFPGWAVRRLSSWETFADPDRPCLLVLGPGSRADLGRLRALPPYVAVLARGLEAQEAAAEAGRVFFPLPEGFPLDAPLSRGVLRSAADASASLFALEKARSEMREVNRIGMALMSERDLDRLLGLILTQARRLTASDAGSLYLVEEDQEGRPFLHFRLSQNDTLPDLPNPDFRLPLDRTSIAGFVASTRQTLVIDDIYNISPDQPYSFNRAVFDEKFGYRGKSMLVVPMTDHKDNVVGVLQLINRKRDPQARITDDASAAAHVLPYTEREVDLLRSLAGQAAVSIENGKLYQEIERVFEGFIKAAVIAIDQRDPTTSGHSVRVTALTCALAEAAHRATEGPFKDVFFSREEMKQLRYAGLLHDFGKVGVREEVLVKMNKLPPVLEARVMARLDYLRKSLEAANERKKVEYLRVHGPEAFDSHGRLLLDQELAQNLNRLEEFRHAILEANTPRVLPQEASAMLDEIAASRFADIDGNEQSILTAEELAYLKIPKGSLNGDERKQIESHVVHSYNYLLQIPWPDELSRIAEIVQGHHEKLDGKGYPRGVTGDQIPLETRFMTVCDIFDALTASDRPYKRAVPVERALAILQDEARRGELDPDVVQLFIESKVYEKVLKVDWREL